MVRCDSRYRAPRIARLCPRSRVPRSRMHRDTAAGQRRPSVYSRRTTTACRADVLRRLGSASSASSNAVDARGTSKRHAHAASSARLEDGTEGQTQQSEATSDDVPVIVVGGLTSMGKIRLANGCGETRFAREFADIRASCSKNSAAGENTSWVATK